ncbi:MAG: EamA family transporter [Verrucomicrobiota bacterium]|nr:EamA family transporter [Verrucomicrobiota bacterium]
MIYLTVVSIIWAFSFGLIGSSLEGLDSFLVATLRLGIASVVFLFFLKIRTIGAIDRMRLVLIGAIQFGVMYGCYMKAFQYIPSHVVAIFSITTPLYVVLIHNFRQKSFSKKFILVALLSVVGAGIIKAQSVPSGDIWMGFSLMQIAGFAFAFGQVAYRDWKKMNPQVVDRSVFALLTLGGFFSVGCFCFLLTDFSCLNISLEQWQSVVYLGIVASGLGFFLWNKGATKVNPGTLAAFNNAVVPLAILCSLFVFEEIESLGTEDLLRLVLGGSLILGAVAMSKSMAQSFD